MSVQRTFLLDAHNLLFRAFASLPPSVLGADQRPVNAVYGLCSYIIRLSKDERVDHIVAAFDLPEVPTFRHRLFPQYQGQRGPLGGVNAEDFARQVEVAFDLLPRWNVPTVRMPGFEADDVMGTIARQVANAGGHATIVSTDRDLLQLVRPRIEVVVPGKLPLRISDPAGVLSRIGVLPAGITTFKALAGDASDNIPGVAGIGAKTAIALIDAYTGLDGIFDHLSELPERTRRLLQAGHAAAYLYRRVATIETELDLPVSAHALPNPLITRTTKVRAIL